MDLVGLLGDEPLNGVLVVLVEYRRHGEGKVGLLIGFSSMLITRAGNEGDKTAL